MVHITDYSGFVPPNQSPEPTAVSSSRSLRVQADGAVSSAVAVTVARKAWLSFLR